MPTLPPIYPVALVVAGRPCLVVGGGELARRKVEGLLAAHAAVTVIAPDIGTGLQELAQQIGRPSEGDAAVARSGALTIVQRPYRAGEAAGYRLVITATGQPEVDGAVADDATAAGVWVNAADDPAHCSVILPSIHRDGPVSIAVSTGGASPALASWLRRTLGRAAPPGLATLAGLLEEARAAVQASGRRTDSVDWAALLDGPLPGLVSKGHIEKARALLAKVTGADGAGTGATGSGTGHHEDEGED